MPVYQIKELKRGSKKFGKNEQTGLFVKCAKEDGKLLKQDVFFTEYHNAAAIQACEQIGIGGWVEITWTKKGDNFYPVNAQPVKGAVADKPSPEKDVTPSPGAKSGGFQRSSGEFRSPETLVRTSALDKAVTFVLGLVGTVIKPGKAEVGTLIPLIADTAKVFENIIQGVDINSVKQSDASGLSKEPPPTKTPEIPDVPPPDGGSDEPE